LLGKVFIFVYSNFDPALQFPSIIECQGLSARFVPG